MTLRSPLSNVSPTNNKHKEKQDQLLQRKVRDEQDMGEVIIARSPKLLRSNSSKKIAATSSLERAFLMMSKSKAWEAGSNKNNKEEDEAATRVQKVFKGHRTRRSLADCAIVVEELWWKLYDSASLDRSSISFFTGDEHHESPASRWVRAGKRIAKLGKGLCKDQKAQQLALRHWLEAIDPRHRYGHNLHLYYDIWFQSSSTQPFFYWLDIGAGREIHHPKCPRNKLNSQLIMYMGMVIRSLLWKSVIIMHVHQLPKMMYMHQHDGAEREGCLPSGGARREAGVHAVGAPCEHHRRVQVDLRAEHHQVALRGAEEEGAVSAFQFPCRSSNISCWEAGRQGRSAQGYLAVQRPLPPNGREFQRVHHLPARQQGRSNRSQEMLGGR